MNLAVAAAAFVIGAVLAYVNYLISKFFIKKQSANVYASFMIRQFINVGYIVGLFFLGRYTPFDTTYLLIGGATGLALTTMVLTAILSKSINKADKKEDDNNG